MVPHEYLVPQAPLIHWLEPLMTLVWNDYLIEHYKIVIFLLCRSFYIHPSIKETAPFFFSVYL